MALISCAPAGKNEIVSESRSRNKPLPMKVSKAVSNYLRMIGRRGGMANGGVPKPMGAMRKLAFRRWELERAKRKGAPSSP